MWIEPRGPEWDMHQPSLLCFTSRRASRMCLYWGRKSPGRNLRTTWSKEESPHGTLSSLHPKDPLCREGQHRPRLSYCNLTDKTAMNAPITTEGVPTYQRLHFSLNVQVIQVRGYQFTRLDERSLKTHETLGVGYVLEFMASPPMFELMTETQVPKGLAHRFAL